MLCPNVTSEEAKLWRNAPFESNSKAFAGGAINLGRAAQFAAGYDGRLEMGFATKMRILIIENIFMLMRTNSICEITKVQSKRQE